MGYESTEGLGPGGSFSGHSTLDPQSLISSLGHNHNVASPSLFPCQSKGTENLFEGLPSEEGILAWGGKDKKQGREAGLKHTTPSGSPKAVVLPGGKGGAHVTTEKQGIREAGAHVQNQNRLVAGL